MFTGTSSPTRDPFRGPPILDFHTHAQNVFGMCCVPGPLRRLARNGLGRVFEKTGFDPRLVRGGLKVIRDLVTCEMQARFATFTPDDYFAGLRRNGVSFACALPVEPLARTEDLVRMLER